MLVHAAETQRDYLNEIDDKSAKKGPIIIDIKEMRNIARQFV